MSRIVQTSKRKDLIPQEKTPLRITQWKFITTGINGIEVCMGYSVFFIHDMDLNTFHKINSVYQDVEYAFEYLRSALICERCGGTGIVDWIGKAAPGGNKTSVIHLHNVLKCVRWKKGPVNKLVGFDDRIIYTSTPHKKIGEEYCTDCYGCGIKIKHFSHQGVTEIYPS